MRMTIPRLVLSIPRSHHQITIHLFRRPGPRHRNRSRQRDLRSRGMRRPRRRTLLRHRRRSIHRHRRPRRTLLPHRPRHMAVQAEARRTVLPPARRIITSGRSIHRSFQKNKSAPPDLHQFCGNQQGKIELLVRPIQRGIDCGNLLWVCLITKLLIWFKNC